MARGIYVPPSGGRAIVLAQHVHGGRVGATGRHMAYLQRDGVGADGGKGQLFTADDRQIDPEAFRYQASHDIDQYRLVVSPWSRGESMQEYTRELMSRVERDLGRETQWLSASHHNTNHEHSHVVIRGIDDHGRQLNIDQRYLEHGIKERAGEVERDRQFDRGYDYQLFQEDRRLHKLAALRPRDPAYQREIQDRLAEIRAERFEMRGFERGTDLEPPRARIDERFSREPEGTPGQESWERSWSHELELEQGMER